MENGPPATQHAAKLSSANYFMRHWRGELTLPVSYWVNGTLLAGIGMFIILMLVNMMGSSGYSLRVIAMVSLAVMSLAVAVTIWSLVGIWRSANLHVSRGGASGWASTAKVMVFLGFLTQVGNLNSHIIPQVKEFGLIAVGKDPIGKISIKIAADGQSMVIFGMLGEGSAEEVKQILDSAPGVKTLVLNSAGGRLLEAENIAQFVRTRGLNTYVEDMCASACTYVFLAGKDRAATPNAKIGFHQPSFPGLDETTRQQSTQSMLETYRAAGLPEAFIQHVNTTQATDMWYPSRDELITANVITRLSLGGETAIKSLALKSKAELLLFLKSDPSIQSYEERFPGTINTAVERAWAAKEKGANDAEIGNAIRTVTVEIMPKLIKTVDDELLNRFGALMVSEMTSARTISAEACQMLSDSKLDITKTLPEAVVNQELKFMQDALNRAPRKDKTQVDKDQFQKGIQVVLIKLPAQYISVISNMKAFSNQPALVCDSIIALYKGIMELPGGQRNIVLRGMFQGDS